MAYVDKELKKRCDTLTLLLREVVMREGLFFPETSQDLEWQQGGIIGQRKLFRRIEKAIGVGKTSLSDEIV